MVELGSGVVRIVAVQTMEMDEQVLQALLNSLPAEITGSDVSFHVKRPGRSRQDVYSVTAFGPEVDRGRVPAILTGAAEALDRILLFEYERARERLAAQMAEEQGRVERTRQAVAELLGRKRELEAQAGRTDFSGDKVRQELSRLEEFAQQLERRIAETQIKTEALSGQLSELLSGIRSAVEADPVLDDLRQLVEIRRNQLAQVREGEDPFGGAQDSVLQRLIEARQQLEDRRRQLEVASGADRLAELQSELTKLSLQLAESQAQLESTRRYQEEILGRNLVELADMYQVEVSTPLRGAYSELQGAEERLKNLQAQHARQTRPEVVLLAP